MRLFVATVFWGLMMKEIKNHMKFLDLFAGIGGFRLGMESAGHECIGFCEIDKFARASYKAIHDTKGEIELHDITAVSDESIRRIGRVDIICGGFPCHPSGNGMNGEVYESAGLAPTLTTNKGEGQKIAIPVLTPDCTDKRQNGCRCKSNEEPMFTLTTQDKHGILIAGKLPGNHDQNSRVYDTNGLAPTLSTMQGGGQEPKIIQRGHGYNQGGEHDIAPTLTRNSYQENNYLSDGFRIRKLTPRECWRLQGFPDWAFDKAQEVNSNSQLYKQAGNSVTVSVIAAIAKELEILIE